MTRDRALRFKRVSFLGLICLLSGCENGFPAVVSNDPTIYQGLRPQTSIVVDGDQWVNEVNDSHGRQRRHTLKYCNRSGEIGVCKIEGYEPNTIESMFVTFDNSTIAPSLIQFGAASGHSACIAINTQFQYEPDKQKEWYTFMFCDGVGIVSYQITQFIDDRLNYTDSYFLKSGPGLLAHCRINSTLNDKTKWQDGAEILICRDTNRFR